MATCSRTFSKDRSVGERASPGLGVHSGMWAPIGMYTKPRRLTGLAAAGAADKAGIMASSTGSAIETPSPRKRLRRGRDFRVTIFMAGAISFSRKLSRRARVVSSSVLAPVRFPRNTETGGIRSYDHGSTRPRWWDFSRILRPLRARLTPRVKLRCTQYIRSGGRVG